jgi:hypothetical protein
LLQPDISKERLSLGIYSKYKEITAYEKVYLIKGSNSLADYYLKGYYFAAGVTLIKSNILS